MRKYIVYLIISTSLLSCSSLQLEFATLNHASIRHTMRPTINTGFNYVLPPTPYTWGTFNYNRFYQPNPFFYSWNYPLNWYYPNQFGYTFNYNNIVSPRRVVRRTPTRPQIQQPRYRRPAVRTRIQQSPRLRNIISRAEQNIRTRVSVSNPRPATQPRVQRRPTQTRPQTRVSVSSSRRGSKSNNK